jgi:hypothetical protein
VDIRRAGEQRVHLLATTDDEPRVSVSGDFTPDTARELARTLEAAADYCEEGDAE